MSSLYMFYWNMVIDEATKTIKSTSDELSVLYEDYNKNRSLIDRLHERINQNRKKIADAESKIKKYQGDDSAGSRTSGPLC
jgi:uncharacterized coiled-coil DUF342 family protein